MDVRDKPNSNYEASRSLSDGVPYYQRIRPINRSDSNKCACGIALGLQSNLSSQNTLPSTPIMQRICICRNHGSLCLHHHYNVSFTHHHPPCLQPPTAHACTTLHPCVHHPSLLRAPPFTHACTVSTHMRTLTFFKYASDTIHLSNSHLCIQHRVFAVRDQEPCL